MVRRRRTYNECEKYNSGRLLLTLNDSNTKITESKPEVQKTLICSKAQLNPVEQQDSATLLLNTSKSLLQMYETENYCKQT